MGRGAADGLARTETGLTLWWFGAWNFGRTPPKLGSEPIRAVGCYSTHAGVYPALGSSVQPVCLGVIPPKDRLTATPGHLKNYFKWDPAAAEHMLE